MTVLLSALLVHGSDPTLHHVVDSRIRHHQVILLLDAHGIIIDQHLLGTAQQAATVTISSELSLLIVGVVLVAFVILAPEGLVGLARRLMQRECA